MKTARVILLIIFALSLAIPSCKKDSKSRKEILTSGSWKLSSMKMNGTAQAIQACLLDDFYTFSTAGTYTFSPGAVKCSSSDISYSGVWSLSTDEKYLIVDGQSSTIIEFSESKVVITYLDGSDNMEMTMVPL
jgi:hypothetical protein